MTNSSSSSTSDSTLGLGVEGGFSRHLKILSRLTPFLWPVGDSKTRFKIIFMAVFLLASVLAGVYAPLLLKDAVDRLAGDASDGGVRRAVSLPLALILAYGFARMLASFFSEIRRFLFARVAQSAVRQIALSVFEHLLRLSLSFHLDRRMGGLSRVIERGVKSIEFLLEFMLFNILPTLLQIGLISIVLWGRFSIIFVAITLLTIGSYILFTLFVTEWRLQFRREMNYADNDAHGKAIDSLINFETVKYFGNEEHEKQRLDTALKVYENAAVRSLTSLSYVNLGQSAIIALGLIVILILAGRGVVQGTFSVGDFVLVNTYLLQLYLPLDFLGFVYRQTRQSLTDMDDLFSLTDETPAVQDRKAATELKTNSPEVSFDKVSFSYDSSRQILQDITFHIPHGKRLAIVGPSGSGKSTIARLLYRFYDVQKGKISISTYDLRNISQASLRASIGVVPQDTVLFNDTIYYNILYGNPHARAVDVERAARLAHIHDFIMTLPDAYQTPVGERGLKLSGGEKQRVAIARTLLKNPGILILDEATSALDSNTEQEIQKNLKDLMQNRTTLMIAHRLSTITEAEEILVISEGKIVERGKHSALLKKAGLYAAMWERQQKEADEGLVANPKKTGRKKQKPSE